MSDETRSQLDPTQLHLGGVVRHHKSDEILELEHREEVARREAWPDFGRSTPRRRAATADDFSENTPESRKGFPPVAETRREAPEVFEPNRLPESSEARKAIPLVTGLLDYFPNALAAIAFISKRGNDKHNPGEPLHWSRGKSNDHVDCAVRHLVDRGGFDAEGNRHTAMAAWRVLAELEEELERDLDLPISRGSR